MGPGNVHLYKTPDVYPIKMSVMNSGLFPATTFVRIALMIENGQLAAKQTNITTSKIGMMKETIEVLKTNAFPHRRGGSSVGKSGKETA